MEKNQVFQTVIEDMNEQGEGIGRVNGYTLFIKDAVIGDRIEGKVVKAKKHYGYGRVLSILEPSPFRVTPRCPAAAPCGGCQLQAMSYERQLQFKEDKVRNHLVRIGGFSEDSLPMEPILGMEIGEEPFSEKETRGETGGSGPFHYRNKGQFPFGRAKDGRIVYGFYAGRTHSIVEAEGCCLGAPVCEKILQTIKRFMEEYHIEPYNEETHSGLIRHALIRTGYHTGEIMVCLVINGDRLPRAQVLTDRLMEIKGMASVSVNINRERTNVILGEKVVCLSGLPYITDRIGALTYKISPQSFYQVNPVQTEKLYGKVLEYAGLTGSETVWDLYCGIGTISLFLAQRAKQVFGVEIVPAAIENARENAKLNGIPNTEFFVGKAEEVVPRWYEEHEEASVDVIVVDPPRKGCDETLLKTMVQMRPGKIIYVSCDSATLARDLKYLCEEAYRVEKVQPVDMFPQGVHCEVCVELGRNKTI
ncbi:23S rRNA (uracil(1939)-C(5))-methyltransferase RlmD [Qiania dongpingensis]|nr:23S rRNA (uracil(1939)-C(5))-methyltransferase RlmD [Qiania dongpingensis]